PRQVSARGGGEAGGLVVLLSLQNSPFPPCGGRQPRLGERSDPRVNRARGRMGGRAPTGAHRRRRYSPKAPGGNTRRCNTPLPTLPPQGGKEQSEQVIAI